MTDDRGDGEGGGGRWFQPYFADWLVEKFLSGWTLLILSALLVMLFGWWLS